MLYENRQYVIIIFIALIGVTFFTRLFYLQVISDQYKQNAYNNTTRRIVEYPYRGLIFDRNKTLLTNNEPIFDLMIDPKKAKIADTLFFLNLLGIKKHTLDSVRKISRNRPIPILKEISREQFSRISSHLVKYPGFYVTTRTIRGYEHQSLSNVLGYMNEVSPNFLKKDTSEFYRPGDYIGISGLEKFHERDLRGERGVKYKQVNVFGSYQGPYMSGKADTLSLPGNNLVLTVDLSLQQYAEQLMKGKRGSVVIIEPSTGEILTIVSSPSYSPSLLSGKKMGRYFKQLEKDTLKPLFNRAIQAVYPPGSIFKTVQGLVALEEKVITADEQINCEYSLIGDHAKRGYYDLIKGIKYSSNNYFYRVFRRIIESGRDPNPFKDARIGLETWRGYISKFGLGHRLGIDIPNEKSGFIPSASYYDKYYNKYGWRMSTIYSLSIGQGELQLTPLQMANIGAIIANRGWYITPHLSKYVETKTGEKIIAPKYQQKHDTGIDREHFYPVIEGMSEALKGTARRALMKDIKISGKTGTVENPPNPDHSVFMCFAPEENPKLAISVYVENAGWGGRAAASIASLLVEYYIKGKVERKHLEDYVLKGDFFD